MVRIQLPSVQLSDGTTPSVGANGAVTPMPDATGPQLQQFGQDLVQAGLAGIDIQATLDNARAKEADTLEREADANLLTGENGYLFSVGKDAIDRRDEVLRQFETTHAAAEKLLTNDIQRQMFNEASVRRRISLLGRVQEHYHDQALAYEMGQTKARAKAAARDAIDSWQDPEKTADKELAWRQFAESMGRFGAGETPPPSPVSAFNQNVATAVQETHRQADLQGLPQDSDVRKEMVRQTRSDINEGVVRRLVSEQRTSLASDYLSKVLDNEILPEVRAEMLGLIRRQGTTDDAVRMARSVIAVSDENEMKAMAAAQNRRVSVVELMPNEQLAKWRSALGREFDAGRINEDTLAVSMRIVEHEADIRESRRNEQIRTLTQQAENWSLNHPLSSAIEMPAEIQEGLQRLNAQGMLSVIEVRSTRARATALKASLVDTANALRLFDEKEGYAESEKIVKQASLPDTPESDKRRAVYHEQRLKELRPIRDGMVRNIEAMRSALMRLQGQISGFEVEEPKDPFDELLEAFRGTTPTEVKK